MKATRDPAMSNLGYERREGDFYETPEWCTEVLLREEKFEGLVWEPACGNNAIMNVLARNILAGENNTFIWGTDINQQPYQNFLEFTPKRTIQHIVTNPPYSHAEEFVRRALKIAEDKVALLLRNEWDCAKKRTDLFTGNGFYKKIVLTKRPRWIKGSTGSPRHNYAWYIWKRGYHGKPTISYGST
jgi:hypothetical protein